MLTTHTLLLLVKIYEKLQICEFHFLLMKFTGEFVFPMSFDQQSLVDCNCVRNRADKIRSNERK